MQNKGTAAGDINKPIQVERRRGSVVEKIVGTASQIARYDNHLNEERCFHLKIISGLVKLLYFYLYLVQNHMEELLSLFFFCKLKRNFSALNFGVCLCEWSGLERLHKLGEDDGVGVGKLLAGGLNLLKGAAKIGVDAANNIGSSSKTVSIWLLLRISYT
ncbi:unnamed protein product [Prunus brigantina]